MMFGLIDLVSFLFVISMTVAVSISSGLSRAKSALAEALTEMGVIGTYLGLLIIWMTQTLYFLRWLARSSDTAPIYLRLNSRLSSD